MGDSHRRLSAEYVEYRDGEEIEQNWRGETVWWSYAISAIGAYVALTSSMFMKQVGDTIWYWLLLMQSGLALGVCSVWSMHFVGMFALHLQTPGKPQVLIRFEPIFTLVSAAAAWLICCIALHIIIGVDRRSVRQNDEERRKLASLSNQERIKWNLRRLPFKRLSISSGLVSVGVVVMHYMGMLSQTGTFKMEYHTTPILLSMGVAVLAAWVALPVFVTTFDSLRFRFVAALLVGVFVNSMHYTGMHAASYYYAPLTGIFGENTRSWSLYFKDVVLFTLILDLTLMGFTGYYVELAKEFVKSEEAHVEKKLAFESYKKNVKRLIQNSRIMRYPMCLVKFDTFVKLGRLVAHERLRDGHKLLHLNTVRDVIKFRKKYHVVFFSHQWLSNAVPDPANRHYKDMLAALHGLAQTLRAKLESMYIWVDYSGIPQECRDQQQLAIDSLATYVSVSSAFVIVAPQTVHVKSSSLCNFDSYSKRFWCRLEVFCTIISSLRSREMREMRRNVNETLVEVLHENSDGSDILAGSTMTSQDTQQQRLFIVVEEQLHPLNFFTRQGTLQPQYQDLINLYNGDTTCCDRGHEPGEENECDKLRVVESLTGAYGAMLHDMRKLRRQKTSFINDACYRLAEEIVRQRHIIFPEKYFDTRIEAVHERLDHGMFASEAESLAADANRSKTGIEDPLEERSDDDVFDKSEEDSSPKTSKDNESFMEADSEKISNSSSRQHSADKLFLADPPFPLPAQDDLPASWKKPAVSKVSSLSSYPVLAQPSGLSEFWPGGVHDSTQSTVCFPDSQVPFDSDSRSALRDHDEPRVRGVNRIGAIKVVATHGREALFAEWRAGDIAVFSSSLEWASSEIGTLPGGTVPLQEVEKLLAQVPGEILQGEADLIKAVEEMRESFEYVPNAKARDILRYLLELADTAQRFHIERQGSVATGSCLLRHNHVAGRA